MKSDPEPLIHNSEDFIVKEVVSSPGYSNTVEATSAAMGGRQFSFTYDTINLYLINSEGEELRGSNVRVIAESSKAKYDSDMSKLWATDKQLAFALKGHFANLQYGYAITSHKAQGSTYTNTYVFEDYILGPTNAGTPTAKNKSLYVAVSRPTTKLVIISERNVNEPSQEVINFLKSQAAKITITPEGKPSIDVEKSCK